MPKTVKITAAGIEDSVELAYGDVSKHATLVQNLGDMNADDDVVTITVTSADAADAAEVADLVVDSLEEA